METENTENKTGMAMDKWRQILNKVASRISSNMKHYYSFSCIWYIFMSE